MFLIKILIQWFVPMSPRNWSVLSLYPSKCTITNCKFTKDILMKILTSSEFNFVRDNEILNPT